MKRSTAIKNATRIAERLRSYCGVLATPGADHEAVRIKRAWVFGSTVKGSENPNDIDILIEMRDVGHVTFPSQAKKKWADRKNLKFCGRLDKRANKYYGVLSSPSATAEAVKTIRKGMKMVSVHLYENEKNFGDITKTMVMIYPRNDFSEGYPQ